MKPNTIRPRQQLTSVTRASLNPTVEPYHTSAALTLSDYLGGWKVRWGIGRMQYLVSPGLYALGSPDAGSQVLVTANYKLTFDTLRKELGGLNVWILVLDTKGVNVWCAAGKGTFGTEELVSRIQATNLSHFVNHRKLLVPQLGATGISAHEVLQRSGFHVIYGPVRAADLPDFIKADFQATPSMRRVRFNLIDRLVLTPVELVGSLNITLMIFGVMFLLNLVSQSPFGLIDAYAYIGAVVAGCIITPIVLPLIIGPAFSWKGWVVGLIWTLATLMLNDLPNLQDFSLLRVIGYFLILPAVSAYYGMNFTGASTYTSLSGVEKEMKVAVPLIVVSICLGSVCVLLNSFFGL